MNPVFSSTYTPDASSRLSSREEHRRQTIAEILGAASFEQLDWRRLLQDGVLVRLHIRRCGFTTRLQLDDLGVQIADQAVRTKLARWLILGEKRLLPESYLRALSQIESRARYALSLRGFRTEFGFFVPSSVYTDWRETTQRLQEDYFRQRDEIVENYTRLVRLTLSEYESIAVESYQRLCQTHPESVTLDQASFVERYCQRIQGHIPSPATILASFAFEYQLVESLSQVAPPVAEGTPLAEQVDRASTTSGRDLMHEAHSRQRQRAEMVNDLQFQARARVNEALDGFLASVVTHLRSLTYEAVTDVLTTLERKGQGQFAPRSVVQLTNLIQQIRSLNFYDDQEVERMMAEIQQIVEQTPRERQRHLPEIRQRLRAIATVTRSTLLDLEQEPRSARNLAIADLPTEGMVRQARAELGLQISALVPVLPEAPRAERLENLRMDSLWGNPAEEARTPRSA